MDKKQPSFLNRANLGSFRPTEEFWGLPLFISLFAVTFTLLVFLVTVQQSLGGNILPAAAVFIFLSAIFWIVDPLLKERFGAVVSSVFLTAIYLGFAQLLILFSGELRSSFFSVYYFVVFTGAMAFGLTGALGVTLVVALAYASFYNDIEDLPLYLSRVLVLWIISLMVGFLAETKKRIERREALQNLRLAALEELANFMRELERPEDVLEVTVEASLKLLDAERVRFYRGDREILSKERDGGGKPRRNMRTAEVPVDLGDATHRLVIERRTDLSTAEERIIRILLEKTRLVWERLHYRALVENARIEKERVLDSIDSGVITLDLHNRVKTANLAASRILGYAPGDLHGRDFSTEISLTPELDLWGYEPREISLRAASGEKIPATIRVFPENDERSMQIGRVAVFEDLKEIRRLEAVLRKSEALAALGEMSSRIAHEVRNPLGGIMGFLGLAEREAPERIKYYIQESSRAVKRLEKTVQDLLIYSTPDGDTSSRVRLQDVWSFLERRVAMESAAHPGVAIELVELPSKMENVELRGGLGQIEQVLGNLIKNGIEAAQDGRVEISARWGGPVIWLEVADTGPGCPEEFVHRMFEPFVSGKASGSGLGLAIAKRIMDSLGGSIRYERRNEQGGAGMTRFRVSWPAEVAAAAPSAVSV